MEFSDNAMTTLCKRYFYRRDDAPLCERCGVNHETVDEFIDRVSMGQRGYREELIEPLVFLPNSPTLFNLGVPSGGTLSACFKFTVEDTMFDHEDGIMPIAMKAAAVLKAGGGVGYSFSKVRPEGSVVKSTHGEALGPLGVMRIYHRLAKEITQGGKRDAAQMGILHCQHDDIEKFIHAKDEDPDSLNTFNISVALTDVFMQNATQGSHELELLEQMAQSAWKTGDPGVYFLDTAERTNPTPWAGQLDGTNPCGEVPLLSNEPCNLGSINLSKFVTKVGGFDWDRLRGVVKLATRYLDDVLDVNVFPHPEIDAAARYTRKLGLGVCGFADVLCMMGIEYDTEEARQLGAKIMQMINETAELTSFHLAEEKGVAPCFEGRDINLRNATRTCIAPTGTIAILMDASSGIEPYFAHEWTRTTGWGAEYIEQPYGIRMTDRKPKTAMDIHWRDHVAMQAEFQRYTNLAVSKTINMHESVTWEDIFDAYMMMWQLGCKGGTIYRDRSRLTQVLSTPEVEQALDTLTNPLTYELNSKKLGAIVPIDNGWRETLPDTRPGVNHRFEVGGVKGYVQVGLFNDGQPGEVFIEIARQGSTLDGLVDWLAHEASIEFQMAHKHGVPFTVFTNKWLGRAFEPSGMTSNKDIPFTSSIADYLARWLNMTFAEVNMEESKHGDTCPECGQMLVFSEGCAHCVCGYERC